MSDVNTCTFSGRLAKDPELKYTQSNKPYCRFPIAVNRYDGREEKEVADFFECVIWDKQAEFLANYFGKGDQVFVTANARKNVWTDKENRTHYDVEFVVRSLVGGRKKGDGGRSERPEPTPPYQGQSNTQAPQPTHTPNDTEVPF